MILVPGGHRILLVGSIPTVRRGFTCQLAVALLAAVMVGCDNSGNGPTYVSSFGPSEGYQEEDVQATFTIGTQGGSCGVTGSRIFVDGRLSGDLVPHDLTGSGDDYQIGIFVKPDAKPGYHKLTLGNDC